MSEGKSAAWIYNQTVKMFAAPAEPVFETPGELEKYWGRAWGIDNDVGRIRAILMHRPGDEMKVIDPKKRIEEIGSLGDLEKGLVFPKRHAARHRRHADPARCLCCRAEG